MCDSPQWAGGQPKSISHPWGFSHAEQRCETVNSRAVCCRDGGCVPNELQSQQRDDLLVAAVQLKTHNTVENILVATVELVSNLGILTLAR